MKRKRIRKKDLLVAIQKSGGKITAVANHFQVTNKTIYNYIEKDQQIADAVDDARHQFDENLCDIAESKLLNAVKAGAVWAVRFSLLGKGKDRGHSERSELTGKNGQSLLGEKPKVIVEFIDADAPADENTTS